MNKTRPYKVTFRLSYSELQSLRSSVEASGFTTQQYLLRAVFSRPLIEKESYDNIIIELRRQGVNLNQLTRACNSGRQEEVEEKLKQTLIKLEELWQFLRLSMSE